MQGAYWYGGLVVVSLVMLAAALYHRRDWRLLVLHLTAAAVIFPFELAVQNFDGYRYLPGILPGIGDNYLGAYISDLFIVPASVVVIRAFTLPWRTRLLFALAFTLIDWHFTVLGIYQHYWWKSVYTGINLLILYAISDKTWSYLSSPRPPRPFRLLAIYLTYAPLHAVLNFAANRGDQLYIMQIPGWHFADPVKASAILVNIHMLITAIVVVLFLGLKMPGRYRLLAPILIIAENWAVGHFGIFVPHAAVSSLHFLLVPLLAVSLLAALFKAARLDYLLP